MEIWASQVSVLSEAMNKIAALPEQIHAIGITNQRETTIIWDKKTGRSNLSGNRMAVPPYK